MEMSIPAEPHELKTWMVSLRANTLTGDNLDWDSYVLWAGNRLPKYLWDSWKEELKQGGFTWQKFLKLLRHRTDTSLMWYKAQLSWNEYAQSVKELVNSPLGQEIAE